MDISQEMLIDIGLNIAGFLVAGGLLLTLYSIVQRQHHQPAQEQQRAPRPTTAYPTATSEPTPVRSRMEFVRFGEPQSTNRQPVTQEQQADGWSKRASVIKTARSMITAGASIDDVRAALPLSDAELAVLTRKRK